jgi:hypothetical protein
VASEIAKKMTSSVSCGVLVIWIETRISAYMYQSSCHPVRDLVVGIVGGEVVGLGSLQMEVLEDQCLRHAWREVGMERTFGVGERLKH